jgi:SAM-dependent methyltransferase
VESLRPAGRLLDIGCAIGTELAVAGQRGWTATGIELAESSVKLARHAGLDVRSQELAETAFPDAHFDLITMNHVLEHVAYTSDFMREIRRILAGNGLLFISLPNVHAWKFYFRRGAYAWTFHHDHFIHFSVETLARFLNRYGFSPVEISSSRWLDFHDPIESRSGLFQVVNRAVEKRGLGIEIFCLSRMVLNSETLRHRGRKTKFLLRPLCLGGLDRTTCFLLRDHSSLRTLAGLFEERSRNLTLEFVRHDALEVYAAVVDDYVNRRVCAEAVAAQRGIPENQPE